MGDPTVASMEALRLPSDEAFSLLHRHHWICGSNGATYFMLGRWIFDLTVLVLKGAVRLQTERGFNTYCLDDRI